jgi:hypothetical protein
MMNFQKQSLGAVVGEGQGKHYKDIDIKLYFMVLLTRAAQELA